MLTAYLIAVAFGGTLLGASLLFGGKGEHPALESGGGGAHGHDHVHDHHDVDASEVLAWLPLTSIRFWSFFATFFGAVGTALTLSGTLGSAAIIAALAVLVGYGCGVGAVAAVRLAGARSANSTTSGGDLVGRSGVLLLGAGPGSPGKVRVDAKGRMQDAIAELVEADGPALPTGARVLVVSVAADGRALVTPDESSDA